MDSIDNIWNRADIISRIADFIYFSIPEEFWDGPEFMLKGLEEYSIEELEEILDGVVKSSEDLSHIWAVKAKIRDEVHSLVQTRLLIVAQISINKDLVDKILEKIRLIHKG